MENWRIENNKTHLYTMIPKLQYFSNVTGVDVAFATYNSSLFSI